MDVIRSRKISRRQLPELLARATRVAELQAQLGLGEANELWSLPTGEMLLVGASGGPVVVWESLAALTDTCRIDSGSEQELTGSVDRVLNWRTLVADGDHSLSPECICKLDKLLRSFRPAAEDLVFSASSAEAICKSVEAGWSNSLALSDGEKDLLALYLGESIRQTLDGVWDLADDGSSPPLLHLSGERVVDPIGAARDELYDGNQPQLLNCYRSFLT